MFSGKSLLANISMKWWQTHAIDEIMDFSCLLFLIVCIYLYRTDIFVKEMDIYRVRSQYIVASVVLYILLSV